MKLQDLIWNLNLAYALFSVFFNSISAFSESARASCLRGQNQTADSFLQYMLLSEDE